MAGNRAEILLDLQQQGKRMCPICGGEVDDHNNMQVDGERYGPNMRSMQLIVKHQTCPE